MNALGNRSVKLVVTDSSQVAEARRTVASFAGEIGFDETGIGRASLVASEMATNLVKHAAGGSLLIRSLPDGLELLAIDQGPGMADPGECLRDGFSTAGSSGIGLGAIKRMSDEFDLCSRPGAGTVVLGRLRIRPADQASAPRFRLGAVALPLDGEEVSGDGWMSQMSERVLRVGVFDGLGHGPDANVAAEAALSFMPPNRGDSPSALLQRIHQGIRHTRGAAGAVYDLDIDAGIIRHAAVGNIAATVISEQDGSRPRALVSHNGTLGHLASRFQESTHPWKRGDILVLASDGLNTRWDATRYPGLAVRDPAVVAGMLWRDASRGRDDVTVLVVREA